VVAWTLYFTGRSAYRSLRLHLDKSRQCSAFVERIWGVVAQVRGAGPAAQALVPPVLVLLAAAAAAAAA
jgi:hypothetical protein